MKAIIPADLIIKTVARHYHLEIGMITCPMRFREYIKAKHIAMYFCRKYTNLSLAQIGKKFRSKFPNFTLDHSTVTYAVYSVNDQIDCCSDYREEIYEINRKLRTKSKRHIEEIKIVDSEVYMENDFYKN